MHYVDEHGVEHAAIICNVWSDVCVNLTGFECSGATRPATTVNYDNGFETNGVPANNTWYWPERV